MQNKFFSFSLNTSFVFLLGHPLSHSVSPPMHNRAFQELGLDFCYFPLEVVDEDLATIFAALRKMRVAGCNVTIPHKLRIMDYLDELDPLAATIGAVNTVVFRDGIATGYNTDGRGFILSLEKEGEISIKGKHVLLLGCGGAARAIAMTLGSYGAAGLIIANRTEEKAKSLAAEVAAKTGLATTGMGVSQGLAQATAKAEVIVNATSLGMHPNNDQSPLDLSLLRKEHIVADIVYNPRKTKLLLAAEALGARTVEGLGMLVYQGAEAFRLFTGSKPPVAEMFLEARRQLAR